VLRFNTYRARRYLRSKFVEGSFLLASEGTDLELEILELLRDQVKNIIGDVSIEDAWKIERLSDTQILIKPGESWFKGFPYVMKGGKDALVSGTTLSLGTIPVGVSIADDATGLGKVITFGTTGSLNPIDGKATPSGTYKFMVTAKEELITEIEDPFLQNVNLTESTAQKIRIVFQISIVPDSIQSETPIPYRDEVSVGVDGTLTPTNFPDTGNDNQPNFVNQVTVSPTDLGGGNFRGTLVTLNSITGSEGIDGRDLELIIENPTGDNPIPSSPTGQAAFSHGTLIDSNGSSYHINFVTNDTVGRRVKIVIDKEYQQEDPVIDAAGGRPYSLVKRELYVTDDTNGVPTGKLHMSIAKLVYSNTNGIAHQSSIEDLRNSIEKLQDYEVAVNTKFSLKATEGGNVSYTDATGLIAWSAGISLINPHGTDMSIATGNSVLVDGGSLFYDLNLLTGGAIAKGTLAVNVTSAGATSVIDPAALADVSIGNAVVDSGGVIAEITAINEVTNSITTTPALVNLGAANIYKDSYR